MTTPGNTAQEKRSTDIVTEYFTGAKSSYDPHMGATIIKIFSGGYHISNNKNEILDTILGSCVAACLRDPVAGVGGMNHFLLPGAVGVTPLSDATRYGVFAMETLINGIMKAGGRKERLEAKVFGGGNVTSNSAKIGSKNAAFIRSFMKQEGIKISSEDLEGTAPRRIQYFPATGRVMMKKLQRLNDEKIIAEVESRYSQSVTTKPVEGDIDLF